MKKIKRSFLSKDAAEAFIEGLEYVNDSAIDNIRLIEPKRGDDFTVTFTDEDK